MKWYIDLEGNKERLQKVTFELSLKGWARFLSWERTFQAEKKQHLLLQKYIFEEVRIWYKLNLVYNEKEGIRRTDGRRDWKSRLGLLGKWIRFKKRISLCLVVFIVVLFSFVWVLKIKELKFRGRRNLSS